MPNPFQAPPRIRSFFWHDNHLQLLDQRDLPHNETWLTLNTWEQVRVAIVDMAVRGAPAIGCVAAYGMALAAQQNVDRKLVRAGLASSRPTAVNLVWALEQLDQVDWNPEAILETAKRIEADDLEMNRSIARFGAELVPAQARILTICNTGSLATAGIGTALGIITESHQQGKVKHVYACETRPRQQGLRLTAWELTKEQVPFQVVVEGATATLFAQGKIDLVIAGADRIAKNGDTANKIGTFMLACLAEKFSVPFVIAAPSSTVDPATSSGLDIPIEERSSKEITDTEAGSIAVEGCPTWNPAFDVTPGDLITAIVTEKGVHRPPYLFA